MTTDVLVTHLASAESAAGQQIFESALTGRLRSSPGSLSLETARVSSLRSPLEAEVRLPWDRMSVLPRRLRGLVAGALLPRSRLHHRLDARIPASAHGLDVVTLLDAAWLHFSDEATPSRAAVTSLKRAAAIVTCTPTMASEIGKLTGRRDAHVIGLGIDPAIAMTPPADHALLARHGLRRPFAICSGGSTARKNVTTLLAAWPQVRLALPDSQLALSGRLAASPGEGVTHLGILPRREFVSILKSAAVMVVPSLYEGFGFPVVEAFQAGVPVVASRRSSLIDVCQDAAHLVEPDAASLAAGVIRVLTSNQMSSELRESGLTRAQDFSWDTCVDEHWELYTQLLERSG